MLDKRDAAKLQQIGTLSTMVQEAGRQAARRLSERLQLKVEAQDNQIVRVMRKDIVKIYGYENVMATGVYTQVKGELPASSMVLIPRDSAVRIVAGATGANPERPVSLSAFTPQMVLKEIGEVWAVTFFEGVAILIQKATRLRLATPEVLFDSWNNTLTAMSDKISADNQELVALWIKFFCMVGAEQCYGVHIYFIEPEIIGIKS